MRELVGFKIRKLFVDADNQHYLSFMVEDSNHTLKMLTWKTEGDCCSETWFYEINGINSLLGATILEVEERELGPIEDDLKRQEEDILYSVYIKTTKGHVDIAFRNSSNGYYGGSIQQVDVSRDVSVRWKELKDNFWIAK